MGGYGMMNPFFMMSSGGVLIVALVVWSLVWKGLALWRAAHREEKGWFVALLVLSTVGILDILYLYVFSKEEEKKEEVKIEEIKS